MRLELLKIIWIWRFLYTLNTFSVFSFCFLLSAFAFCFSIYSFDATSKCFKICFIYFCVIEREQSLLAFS